MGNKWLEIVFVLDGFATFSSQLLPNIRVISYANSFVKSLVRSLVKYLVKSLVKSYVTASRQPCNTFTAASRQPPESFAAGFFEIESGGSLTRALKVSLASFTAASRQPHDSFALP